VFLFDLFLELKQELGISINMSQTLSQAVDEKIVALNSLSKVVANFGQTFGTEDIPLG
jgi:acyl carrier protein